MRAKMWMSYIDVCNVQILLTTISSINLFNNNTKMKTIYSVFFRGWSVLRNPESCPQSTGVGGHKRLSMTESTYGTFGSV